MRVIALQKILTFYPIKNPCTDAEFEGGIGYPKATFELLKDGGTKVVVVTATNTYKGTKYLKY